MCKNLTWIQKYLVPTFWVVPLCYTSLRCRGLVLTEWGIEDADTIRIFFEGASQLLASPKWYLAQARPPCKEVPAKANRGLIDMSRLCRCSPFPSTMLEKDSEVNVTRLTYFFNSWQSIKEWFLFSPACTAW